MPYDNAYNHSISSRLRNIEQNHVNRINAISETNSYDVVSPMEHTTLHNAKITGGSGFAAATVQDLGFEPTMGATAKGGSKRSKYSRSLAAKGTTEGGVATSGMQALPEPMAAEVVKVTGARASKIKAPPHQTDNLAGGALLTLQDLDKMHGQPPEGRRKYRTPQAGVGEVRGTPPPPPGQSEVGGSMNRAVGGSSRQASARNTLVKEVMVKHKLSLPAASKYIKEHGLYKK
jgi:hypothetical protein